MDIENPAFTGFFNDGHKRIDLVLVIKDTNSNEIEETRLNFLMNAIKFNLELEIEQGKLPEHKNLMFIKVHAPDAIIEEFGLYFKERKFFKESHIEFINPLFNFLGMQHERELIKLIRNLYPGPVNYSTLERSKIVYQILLQLQFGQYENHFGINKLIRRKIILDAFALHDGPYFIQSKQEPRKYVNARQVLFYNWTGIINVWKTQPIHMIQEYLGKRVAFFFAYYQYFNMMLIIISAVGSGIALAHYFEEPQYDIITKSVCSKLNIHGDTRQDIVCSECRNFTICPFLKHRAFCKELKFINRIDTKKMQFYAYFVTIWGLLYVVLWKRREKYLLWMWEVHEKYVKNLTRPEYESHTNIYKESKRTGLLLEYESIHISIIRVLILLISVAIFSAWVFALILISIHMCYFKHWYTYIKKTSFDQWKRHEHEYIGMAALMYTSTIFVFKIISATISRVLTEFEKHKTFRSYDQSLAIKMYAFCFSCTFTLLTTYIFVGEFFFTHILDMRNWYSLGGFAMLNNGLGTSLDDICVTLAVIVVVEQIVFKIPTFFFKMFIAWIPRPKYEHDYMRTFNKITILLISYSQTTDYNQVRVLDVNTPCWEGEYKLPNITETCIHNSYCTIAIQFALTLFSCAFPLTPLIILLINIWEIRHKARKLLLGHRRPLLLNVSGPGIWHRLIFATAHVIPLFNVAMIIFQSRLLRNSLTYGVWPFGEWRAGFIQIHEFAQVKEYTELYEKSIKPYIASWDFKDRCITFDEWINRQGNNFDEPTQRWWFLRSFGLELMLFFEGSLLLVSLWMHYLFRPNANDIQDTIRMENKIKHKIYIR